MSSSSDQPVHTGSPASLAPFEPRWEGGTLVLVLRRFSQRMITLAVVTLLAGLAAVVFAPVGLWLLAGPLAALAGLSTLGALRLWMRDRHDRVELRLTPDEVSMEKMSVRRDDVGTVSTQSRALQIRSARSIFTLLHAPMLDHPPAELAQLGRVIRAWTTNPAFGPETMDARPRTDLSLLDRLEPLGAEPHGTGVRFFVREQRRSDFLFPLLGGVLGACCGAVLAYSGASVFIGLWIGAAVGVVGAIARWVRRRAEVHLDDRGISLVGRWTVSWDQLEAASVTEQQGVHLHTRSGGQTLEMASIRYAPVLAALLTDLASPDPEQHVPDGLRQMVARWDKGRQEA